MPLNRVIVARLRMIHQWRIQIAMVEFRIAEREGFETDDDIAIKGTVVRWNKKRQH
jgi:hypothetical protein